MNVWEKNQDGDAASPQIFSVHFWNDTGTDKNRPDYVQLPDGKVDMSNWNYSGRPSGLWNNYAGGGFNFDYGFYHYDPQKKESRFRHANHFHDPNGAMGPMTVYDSSGSEWNQSNSDFNTQIFCVACNTSTW